MELRRALDNVPPDHRDAWVDALLGTGDIPADTPELPAGCVPYLPCPVDTILAMLDAAEVGPSDTLVDLGCGLGRVTLLAHLLTGARAIGIDIQAHLVARARALAAGRVTILHGDAADLAGPLATGTVYFLYCPFSGARLDRVLAQLSLLAPTRPLRVCTVDIPPLARTWLAPIRTATTGLAVYRSTPPPPSAKMPP